MAGIKNHPLPRVALIVAGGRGIRMGADIPKQFLLLQGRPLLMHSIEAFEHHDAATRIILVLPAGYLDYWKETCDALSFSIPHETVAGGETRAESVRNGLKLIEEECFVAIHDGARPLVSPGLISSIFGEAEAKGNAVPAIHPTDAARIISADGVKPIPKENVLLIQTPQCFRFSTLTKAYKQLQDNYPDDAGLVESLGVKIHIIEGEHMNIKITHPEDIPVAGAILQQRDKSTRPRQK
jgi:2-C-methyl-D-erythritol 4-phosphate cytidylyltransferase